METADSKLLQQLFSADLGEDHKLSDSQIESLRKYAWDYFQLHSSQRITTFNFYITLSTAIIAGIGTTLQLAINLPIIATLLGTILLLISFVFWKLDQRNKEMIKNVEIALKILETVSLKNHNDLARTLSIFHRDDEIVAWKKSRSSWMFWKNHYSYTDCFNTIFYSFGLIGILGISFSLVRILFS